MSLHLDEIVTSPITFLGGFMGTSAVFNAVEDPAGTWDAVQPILQSITGGRYLEAVALLLVVACAAVRKFGPNISSKMDWVKSDAGGALLVFLGSLGGATATALAAGQLPSFALFFTATKVAFAASGGYTLVKRLAVPALEWLAVRAPQWTHWVFDIGLWVFGRNTAIAIAEKAGKDAVVANPGTGVAAVVGVPKDVP